MNVSEIMTTDVLTARPTENFKELVERMLTRRVSCLPIVDEQGYVLGMVSESDLLASVAYQGDKTTVLGLFAAVLHGRDAWLAKKAGAIDARDLMTRSVVTTRPDDDIREVACRLLDWGVNHAPVVEDDRLVGIVSRQDILRVFRRTDHDIDAELRGILADPAKVPAGARLSMTVQAGVVSLLGTVEHQHDVEILKALVRDVPGAVAVQCDLASRNSQRC